MSASRPSRIASAHWDARRWQSAANSCSSAMRAARRDEERLAVISEDGLAWFATANVAGASADRVSLRFGAVILGRDVAPIGGRRRCAALIVSHVGVAPAGMCLEVSQVIVSAPPGGLMPYSHAFGYWPEATNAVIFVTCQDHVSVNDVELQDREFLAAIRQGPRAQRKRRRHCRATRYSTTLKSCLSRAEARPHPARGTQHSVIVVDASAILSSEPRPSLRAIGRRKTPVLPDGLWRSNPGERRAPATPGSPRRPSASSR
jgi:hypothetical protein